MASIMFLESGLWDVPRNEIIQAESPEVYAENRRYTITGMMVLIKDVQLGNVLFDTGINRDWETMWPAQFKRDYTFHHLNDPVEELKKCGMGIDEIDLIICSHLHYDHAGNLSLFRNTKAGRHVLISRAEAQEAFVKTAIKPDGVSGAYLRTEFVMDGIGYQLLEEEKWISDDIYLLIQEGHTPGVIGMIVKTEYNGNFLFPSDAVYSSVNYGPPVVLPGLCIAPEAYRKNVERLQQLKTEYDAQIVFGHDCKDFENWEKAPFVYR